MWFILRYFHHFAETVENASPGAIVVQLKPNWRVAVGYNLTPELVHCKNCSLVTIKVDEAVASRLSGELVTHYLIFSNEEISYVINLTFFWLDSIMQLAETAEIENCTLASNI